MLKKIRFFIVFWTLVSMGFWLMYSIFVEYVALGWYMPLFFGLLGVPLYMKRHTIEATLKNWKLHPGIKFALLGYSMILLEEIIAGVVNHAMEDFSLPILFIRILQFQFFNLFAFTGFIFGVYISLRLFFYTRTEIFFVAGLWGLYVEKVLSQIFINPAYVILTALPTILIYGIILYPSLLAIEIPSSKRNIYKFLKYSLTGVLIFICSILPMFFANTLRTHHPFLFPPEHLLPLYNEE